MGRCSITLPRCRNEWRHKVIAGILLTRQRIHDYLKSLGHADTGVTFSGATGSYRFWKTPWGHNFPVPDDDYMLPTWGLEQIVDDANKTRPAVH